MNADERRWANQKKRRGRIGVHPRSSAVAFPYVWVWDECSGCVHKAKKPRECPPHCTTYRPALQGRKGKRCRVITRGPMNTAIVEFIGGHRTTVSRSGLRKARSP